MAITVAQFQTQVTAAQTAIAASDWATAESALQQAIILLAGIPDGEQGVNKLSWDRKSLLQQLTMVRQNRNAAAGIRYSRVRMRPVREDDCGC